MIVFIVAFPWPLANLYSAYRNWIAAGYWAHNQYFNSRCSEFLGLRGAIAFGVRKPSKYICL